MCVRERDVCVGLGRNATILWSRKDGNNKSDTNEALRSYKFLKPMLS